MIPDSRLWDALAVAGHHRKIDPNRPEDAGEYGVDILELFLDDVS